MSEYDAEVDGAEPEVFESGRNDQARQAQRRIDIQIRIADAQMITARAMEQNARYMLWSMIAATVASLACAAAIVAGVIVNLPRAPH
jgi:hypothetical protein